MKNENTENSQNRIEKAIDFVSNFKKESLKVEEIKSFIDDNSEDIKQLAERLSNEERINTKRSDIAIIENEREKRFNRFVAEIRNSNKKSNSRRGRITLRVVAASVVAAVIAISFIIYTPNSTESTIETAQLQEEISTPVLITAEGAQHSLDGGTGSVLDLRTVAASRINYIKSTEEIKYNKVIVPKASILKFILPDSSIVTLNAKSSLCYDPTFKSRVVELEGEAFFDIRKSDNPFIVKTKREQVKVYGTKFNVESYDDSKFKTVLVEGSVGVTINNGNKEVMLKPSEMIDVESNGSYTVKQVNVEEYISWQEKRFKFLNISLDRAAEELSRWYDVKIDIDEEVKELNINIYANKGKSIDSFIEFFEILYDVKFEKNEDAYGYTVRKK